ncbi:MAG: DUF1850 domain-containing protein [Deltaproteobacteria bacterium]|nr:DUF1850 domain-containing protein [Deltaproteobacteria bacterium]
MPLRVRMLARLPRRLRFGLLLAAALLLFIPWPGFFYALRITHEQAGQELFNLPYIPTHSFDLSFINSIYLAPTVEKFELNGLSISLREITTTSWGVIEYYNPQGTIREEKGTIRVRDINFRTPKLNLMIGYIGKQKIIWDGRNYLLYAATEPGAVLILEPVRISPAQYLWKKMLRR